MVDVLPPGHQHEGDGVVVPLLAGVDGCGHEAGRGEGVTGGGGAGGGDAVRVIGGEEPKGKEFCLVSIAQ